MQRIIKQKKQRLSRTIYCALCFVLLLCSCQKEELLSTGGDTPQGTSLSISVTDGGYTDSNPRTRSVENGYLTEFTAGDQIGLYVVKPDGSYAHENIALTLTDVSGKLTWQAPAGTNLYYEGVAAKYFAYYPYRSMLEDETPPGAAITTPTDFFGGLITAWNPAVHQSTYASYTSQDLMIGGGTVSKQGSAFTLSFTMTHAMALVVVETPTTKYTFTNSPTIPDYYIPAPNTKFYGFTPCYIDGKYRLLVKPAQSGATDLTGSYTGANGKTKEYAVSPNSITAANYACYKVDGGSATIIEKSHTLQPGDFYLKDGSLLGKDETPTEEQKAACIGIVYWLGDITGNDPLLARDKPDCTHGLVVALHEAKQPSAAAAAAMYWSINTERVNNWTNHGDRGADKVNITEENKLQGYANTVALKAYNAQQNNANLKVLPIAAIEQYQADYPAPANSSGWYVPSIMELKYVCWGQGNVQSAAGRDLLNGQFAKAGGTPFDTSWVYWSSSESADNSGGAWTVLFRNGYVRYSGKGSGEFWVRALFAF